MYVEPTNQPTSLTISNLKICFTLYSLLPAGLPDRLHTHRANLPGQPHGHSTNEHEQFDGAPAGCNAPHDTHTATDSGDATGHATAEAAGHPEGPKQADEHDQQRKFECTDLKRKEHGQRERTANGRGPGTAAQLGCLRPAQPQFVQCTNGLHG